MKIEWILRVRKGFFGLANITNFFQEKIERTLDYSTPAWLDDLIVITKEDRENLEKIV